MDGNFVHNFTEYDEAIEGDGTFSVNILRFTDSGYDLVESAIDSALGRIGMLGLNEE